MQIKTPIIPVLPTYYKTKGRDELDYKSIAIYAALGFFLDDSTFFKNLKTLKPASVYNCSQDGDYQLVQSYFNWHYSPDKVSVDQVVEEFHQLFGSIVQEMTLGKQVILPLSGGLDSRTLAAALEGKENVHAYSYKFEKSFNESSYGKKIAALKGWPFSDLTVPSGYLWNSIKELSSINQCYSEFTHPRQMAFVDQYKHMGDVFLLGHWGDVLFDDMGVSEDASFDELVEIIKKKVIKKGGAELAIALWQEWGLAGDFEQELTVQIAHLLSDIKIDNNNARIRAFKSMYWAPRWTSVNLSVFQSVADMALPYYDNRMCEFICGVPEKFLAARQVQIEYIKRYSPELAKIPWQTYHPLNLNNYNHYYSLTNLPNRIIRKTQQSLKLITGKDEVLRNWEIQFLGSQNRVHLEEWLFGNKKFKQVIPDKLVRKFYDNFNHGDQVHYSHPLSMLLTLSLFSYQSI